MAQRDAPQSASNAWTAFILLCAVTYLYLNLFALPSTPFLLGGDQVYFWLNAQRMLDGRRIYQDFFQFTPPGADLFYFAVFKLFGFRIWVTNAVVLALGIAFVWLCYSLAREIMGRNSAILTSALTLVLIYGKALNATHHWFSAMAVMAALKICFSSMNTRRLAIAGALLGLAAFISQTHGAAALLAFALFLFWRRARTGKSWASLIRDQAVLLLGFAATLLLLSAHYIHAAGLKQLWYFQVTYVREHVVELSQGNLWGLPKPITWRTLPALSPYLAVYIALPTAYLLSLWRCWRDRLNPAFPWDRIALLTTVGLFLLVEVSFSPNWLRLYAISMPAIILLGAEVDRLTNFRRYAIALLWVGIIGLAFRQTLAAHLSQTVRATLPGGAVATTPQAYEKLHWIEQRTSPGEFFFQAGWPGVYLPLQLRNPLYLDTAYAAPPQEAEQAVQQLQASNVKFILWTPHLDALCSSLRPCDNGIAPIRDYLHNSYICVHAFPDGDTLWQRNK